MPRENNTLRALLMALAALSVLCAPPAAGLAADAQAQADGQKARTQDQQNATDEAPAGAEIPSPAWSPQTGYGKGYGSNYQDRGDETWGTMDENIYMGDDPVTGDRIIRATPRRQPRQQDDVQMGPIIIEPRIELPARQRDHDRDRDRNRKHKRQ